eukprot:203500-Rhodomonas_salina.1
MSLPYNLYPQPRFSRNLALNLTKSPELPVRHQTNYSHLRTVCTHAAILVFDFAIFLHLATPASAWTLTNLNSPLPLASSHRQTMAAMDWGLSSPGMFNNTLAQALQPKPWLISPLLNNQTVAGANQSLLNSNTLHQAINSFSHPLMTTPPNTTASPQAGLNMNQLLMQNSPLLQQAPTQPPTQAPAKPNPLVNSLQLQQAINILSEQAQMNQGNKLPYLALSSLIASQNSTMNNQLVNRRPVHGFSFPNANQPYLAESTDNTTDSGSKGSDESGSDGGDAHGQAGSVSDKGERRSKSWKIMLTAEQAVVIYKERPTGSSRGTGASVAVGKKFGVSAKTIRDIWNRETW